MRADGYRLRLVDLPEAFDRAGGYYGDEAGDYPDNAWRFGTFCRAALATLESEGRPPDLLHLHDWHSGPAVRYVDPGPDGPATLMTVHNLAYHGWTARERVPELGPEWLPRSGRRPSRGIDLLRQGLRQSDLVNTVSPGFAREALRPAFGMGLDGLLRRRRSTFIGILNGLDTDLWDPATDSVLAATYSRADRSGKAACRADLLQRTRHGPGSTRRPVLGMIGRLDPQKGFDILAAAAPALLADGFRLVVQGSGPPELVAGLRAIATAQPDRVALIERFDRDMARRIYAGADGFLMPSRFEPCGTGQMVSLRYGTPPIVHETGGLADTVIDETEHPGAGTGFVFRHDTPAALRAACRAFEDLFTCRRVTLGGAPRPRDGRRFRLAIGLGAGVRGRLPASDRHLPGQAAARGLAHPTQRSGEGAKDRDDRRLREQALRRVRSLRDREEMLVADAGREPRQDGVGHHPARGELAANQPGRDVPGGRIRQARQAAVPVAVPEQDGEDGIDIELRQAERLGPDVAVGPARVDRADRGLGIADLGIRSLEGIAGHLLHRGDRHGRRIEEEQPCRVAGPPPAGRRRPSRPTSGRGPRGRAGRGPRLG